MEPMRFLKQMGLFRSIHKDREKLLKVAALMDGQAVPYGHTLIEAGSPSHHIYLVRAGQLKVREVVPEEAPSTEARPGMWCPPRKRRRSIALIGPGDVFEDAGEPSADGSRYHTLEVQAVSQGCGVYRIDFHALERVLGKVSRPSYTSDSAGRANDELAMGRARQEGTYAQRPAVSMARAGCHAKQHREIEHAEGRAKAFPHIP